MRSRVVAAVAAVVVVGGCGGDSTSESDGSGGSAAPSGSLILATTTSTVDSGLLDELVPMFEEQVGCTVKALGVGSGEALGLGESGDADALLVHSPAEEQQYMESGAGLSREAVMHNDFVLAGPPGDPAGIASAPNANEALRRIADAEATFVSRADDSGTHVKELELWDQAGVDPGGDWYLETGQGMGETLTITSQKQGYTLSDRGTYLATEGLELDVLTEGGEQMQNYYHVIVVDAEGTNVECARAFSDWITSAAAQAAIGEYGVDEFGQVLFTPDAKT